MAVKNLPTRGPNPMAGKLKRLLAKEWRKNTQDAQPVILIEKTGPYRSLHIYVVWDKWEGVSQIERSEIIMDAYERIHDLETALEVTLAMGLTPEEADSMGIKYR
jgi:hypothetical protein